MKGGVPASPPAVLLSRARWGDLRVVAGVLVVLASVVLGARVVSAAGRTEPVWVLTRTLAAGSTIGPDDVAVEDVQLGSASQGYLPAAAGSPSPEGRALLRSLGAGELVPASALASATAADAVRSVTVPVDPLHAPPGLDRGQLVDVYVTPGSGTSDAAASSAAVSGAAGPPTRVLAAALVTEVERDPGRLGSSSTAMGVVLAVPDDRVAALLAALRSGGVDLVGVTSG